MTDTDLMTAAEVAELAKVTRATVARWADSGQLPTAMQLPGGARRFHRPDVEALLAPTEPETQGAA